MTEDKISLPRRKFLKVIYQILAVTGMGALLTPIIAFFWPAKLEEIPSEPKAVGPVDSLPVGEGVTVSFGRYPVLVINTAESGIVAYSAVCTHFACLVKWNPASGMIECPCHEGYFDPSDGSVISGPPPRALDKIHVFSDGNTLFIGGEA